MNFHTGPLKIATNFTRVSETIHTNLMRPLWFVLPQIRKYIQKSGQFLKFDSFFCHLGRFYLSSVKNDPVPPFTTPCSHWKLIRRDSPGTRGDIRHSRGYPRHSKGYPRHSPRDSWGYARHSRGYARHSRGYPRHSRGYRNELFSKELYCPVQKWII